MANRKKDFTTPTEAFISVPEEAPAEMETFKIPAGYRLVREGKSKRMQLLVTPTTASELRAVADREGLSLNELCNRIFETYLKGNKG